MRHDSGVLGQALDSAQGLSEGEDLEGGEEAVALFEATLEEEGNHAARAAGLLLGDIVLRVRRKAGIDNLINEIVLLEILRNAEGVLLVSLHAKREGLHATHSHV